MKKSISLLLSVAMLFSILCMPAYAEADSQKVAAIADQTYQTNLNKLGPIQQQEMKNIFTNIEHKYLDDPEGYISMGYMTMVTEGADNKAGAVMAAWGVQRYPDSLCLVNNLGYSLYLLKDYENCIEIYKQALAMDPKSLETIINLGNVYMDMNRDEEAKTTYESALAIDKEYDKAWEGLYGYYMKKKDYTKAMEIIVKIKPGGFISRGRQEMQQQIDAQPQAAKLDYIEDGDTLEVMEQKIARISQTKPINVAPIVDNIDPEMALKIKDEMENLKVSVAFPDTPWPVDFTNAEQYYITSRAYDGNDFMSASMAEPTIDPQTLQKAKQIEALSDAEIDSMVNDYLKDVSSIMNQIQGTDLNDFSQLTEAMKKVKNIPADPFASLPSTSSSANGQQSSGQGTSAAATPSTYEQLGLTEKKGVVTTSNYNNYIKHKMNFKKYFPKMLEEFTKGKNDIGKSFDQDMSALVAKQKSTDKDFYSADYKKQRNNVRDKYVQEFGNYLNNFYRGHVKPALEKVENTEALYIKNMGNKQLKSSEAQMMKAEINGFLKAFSDARAPVDDYETVNSAAAQQLEQKIEAVKANAPKDGETLPQLKNYEDQQRGLLEKIVEDRKYEKSCGWYKISYENAELSLGWNDVAAKTYMELGVSIKDGDLSASLTERQGFDVQFSVATGEKGSKASGLEAKVGVASLAPGKKTTIYFDEWLTPVDAKITSVDGSTGLSAEVEAADMLAIEGGVKVETTAEGTSEVVTSVKASYKDITLVEDKYKEKLQP